MSGAGNRALRCVSARSGPAGRASVAALLLLLVTGCTDWFSPPEDPGPELLVYADHYRFRGQDYESERGLHIAILAYGQAPTRVILRECVAPERMTALIELLREHERANLDVRLPNRC